MDFLILCVSSIGIRSIVLRDMTARSKRCQEEGCGKVCGKVCVSWRIFPPLAGILAFGIALADQYLRAVSRQSMLPCRLDWAQVTIIRKAKR